MIHQPLLKYKFKQHCNIISPLAQLVEGLPHNLKVQGSNPYSSLQAEDRLNIDREFWSQVIYKAYTCERRLSPKSSTKSRLQFLFFMLIFYYLMCNLCVHLASITQGCCEYTHITNILRVLWLVRACSEHIACAFCSKNMHAQTLYAHKCALAIRMLHVCGLHAAYSQHAGCELFFSARGMFAIFLLKCPLFFWTFMVGF